MAPPAVCAFCGEPVVIRPGAYREVSGWEPVRSAGGGNTVALAVRTGRFAHNYCVMTARHPRPPWDQLAMEFDT